jgi:dipeptidyl-peptidase-3
MWIRDKSPPVDVNMGWVEAYIDPEAQRASWDSWVALVDKERSEKFAALVADSDHILPKMPWG